MRVSRRRLVRVDERLRGASTGDRQPRLAVGVQGGVEDLAQERIVPLLQRLPRGRDRERPRSRPGAPARGPNPRTRGVGSASSRTPTRRRRPASASTRTTSTGLTSVELSTPARRRGRSPLVIVDPQPLGQAEVTANKPGGGIKQPSSLAVRRRRQKNFRSALPVNQLVQRERGQHRRLPVLAGDDQHDRPPILERLTPESLCHASSFNGCPRWARIGKPGAGLRLAAVRLSRRDAVSHPPPVGRVRDTRYL